MLGCIFNAAGWHRQIMNISVQCSWQKQNPSLSVSNLMLMRGTCLCVCVCDGESFQIIRSTSSTRLPSFLGGIKGQTLRHKLWHVWHLVVCLYIPACLSLMCMCAFLGCVLCPSCSVYHFHSVSDNCSSDLALSLSKNSLLKTFSKCPPLSVCVYVSERENYSKYISSAFT